MEMISSMRKEFPMEDGGRTDKDDRFFGRTIDIAKKNNI
jgi:NADH-quinone oxidoreductase subunit C